MIAEVDHTLIDIISYSWTQNFLHLPWQNARMYYLANSHKYVRLDEGGHGFQVVESSKHLCRSMYYIPCTPHIHVLAYSDVILQISYAKSTMVGRYGDIIWVNVTVVYLYLIFFLNIPPSASSSSNYQQIFKPCWSSTLSRQKHFLPFLFHLPHRNIGCGKP